MINLDKYWKESRKEEKLKIQHQEWTYQQILKKYKDNNLLQLKDLRVGQWKEPYIGLTQENLIENSVQDCLSYIQILNGPCKLFLAYPKQPCVLYVIWHHPSRTFYNLPCIMWSAVW